MANRASHGEWSLIKRKERQRWGCLCTSKSFNILPAELNLTPPDPLVCSLVIPGDRIRPEPELLELLEQVCRIHIDAPRI